MEAGSSEDSYHNGHTKENVNRLAVKNSVMQADCGGTVHLKLGQKRKRVIAGIEQVMNEVQDGCRNKKHGGESQAKNVDTGRQDATKDSPGRNHDKLADTWSNLSFSVSSEWAVTNDIIIYSSRYPKA